MAALPEQFRLIAPVLRSSLGALCVFGLVFAAPVAAKAEPTVAEALAAMRERDQTLLDIAWKLTTANAPFCENANPAIGIMFLDTGSFPDPAEINEALEMDGNVLVQAVAKGSPAESSGFAPLMPIIAIDDEITAWAPQVASPTWEYLRHLNQRLSDSLSDSGSVNMYYLGLTGISRTSLVKGAPACTASIEQRDGEDRAQADSTRIMIGSNFPGFAYPEEEFAAAIAHELAHIVLGHSAWLDEEGRNRRNVRRTEREADRLAPWLLANAGYDPLAAERFMRRWGPNHSGGLFRKRTHDGWDERADATAAEATLVTEAMEMHESGAADWQRHFTRDISS